MEHAHRSWELLREGGPRRLARGVWGLLTSQKKYLFWRTAALARHLKHRVKWPRSAPSPDRLLYVSPASVEHVLALRFEEDLPYVGTYIKGGNWDQRTADRPLTYLSTYEDGFNRRAVVPYDDYVLYRSFVERFERGAPWRETDLYQWLLENRDRDIGRYETVDAIEARFEYLDGLYRDMKQNGYRTQAELDEGSKYHEVLVDVGRDGQFILDDGRHRFSIAKILDLDSVPVRVLVRHEKWQRIRHEVATEGPDVLDNWPAVDTSHPDLKDVLHVHSRPTEHRGTEASRAAG